MDNSIVSEKSLEFAVRIVNVRKYLVRVHREYVMSKQLLRCGTSIGANIAEGQRGQSKADFSAKMNIALKEANETHYWIQLLFRTGYLTKVQYNSLLADISELLRLLTSICKTVTQDGLLSIIKSLCTTHYALCTKNEVGYATDSRIPISPAEGIAGLIPYSLYGPSGGY